MIVICFAYERERQGDVDVLNVACTLIGIQCVIEKPRDTFYHYARVIAKDHSEIDPVRHLIDDVAVNLSPIYRRAIS